MKDKTLVSTITQMSKRSAIKNTDFFCRLLFHQPKVPAKLLEIKKAK